ncbi:MAG: hydrogenase-4 component G [Epsilonproteobacteria bacterium]|nr:hydrogenase-4 component G [Campylobacterota bacterium]
MEVGLSNTNLNLLYKKTQMEVDFVDKNGKKVNFSMTFEDINLEYEQDVSTFTTNNLYDQSKIADILNKGEYDKLDDILKKLKEKHTKVNASMHSVKIEGLTPEEAKKLVEPGGYFSVDETAKRVFDFVIKGANDDPNMLKAGYEGVVQGLKDAEEVWGGKLPDIAYKTQEKTLSMLSEYMQKHGISVFDAEV